MVYWKKFGTEKVIKLWSEFIQKYSPPEAADNVLTYSLNRSQIRISCFKEREMSDVLV